jgi:hypothetical protein
MIRRDMRPRLPASLLFAALVACFAVVACGDIGITGTTPTPPSGIKGTVILGPTCPVNGAPESNNPVPSACLTPYAAQMVVLDDENKAVAHIASGNDGTFKVDLTPGDYVLAPASSDAYPIAQPVSVTVVPGQYVTVQVNYDTGIR